MVSKVPIAKLLANRINEMRITRQWSYNDMGRECSLERVQAHKICTGAMDLRISTLVKIADGFGITLAELVNANQIKSDK